MKNFTIQSLAVMVMVMVIVVVYPASITSNPEEKKLLLEEIKNEIDHLIRNKTVPHEYVEKIPNNGITCVKEFFCLAGKILNHTSLSNSTLNRNLIQYNNLMNHTVCTLKSTGKQSLKQFLEEVKVCANKIYKKL